MPKHFLLRPRRSRRMQNRRRATAVTELAVCLPLLLLITIATIESCTMLHLRQRLSTTAFEATRVGIVPGATSTNVTMQGQILLDAHRVQDYSISMDPADPRQLEVGDFFTVTVSAGYRANSLIGGWIYADRTLSKSVSLSVQ